MKEVNHELKVIFPRPLTKAFFIERPNRFIIHCRLESNNEEVVVHLADPGRLRELLLPGSIVWLLENNNPNRKTKWTAVLCENPTQKGYISINTTFPNQLVEKALRAGAFEEFKEWSFKKAEYKLGDSRWDFLLENEEGRQLLLEVKSVTLAQDGKGMFPDAVTARGTKHVKELTAYARDSQYETAVLFVAQREDIKSIEPAKEIDPNFAQALIDASKTGVKLFGRTCHISIDGIEIGTRIPVVVN